MSRKLCVNISSCRTCVVSASRDWGGGENCPTTKFIMDIPGHWEIEIVIPEREDGERPVGLVWPPVPDGHSPEVVGPHAQPPRLPGPGHVSIVDDGRHVVMDEVALEAVDVDQQRDDSQQRPLEDSQRQKLRAPWKWQGMFKVPSTLLLWKVVCDCVRQDEYWNYSLSLLIRILAIKLAKH